MSAVSSPVSLASIPAMFVGKWMSMPLYSAAGIIGALIHDLAPRPEDIWFFSPFVDLNLWRLLRQLLRWKRDVIQRRLLELAAFNLSCNFLVVLVEALRWGVRATFPCSQYVLSFRISALSITIGSFYLAPLPLSLRYRFRFVCGAASARSVNWKRSKRASPKRACRPYQSDQSALPLQHTEFHRHPCSHQPQQRTQHDLPAFEHSSPPAAKTENYSPLREEIAFIDDYLAIEMVRFGDKLKFEKQIEPATLNRPVPSMILQPIIENSIRHGLANKVEGGTVRLRTWLEGTRLNIQIEDDGVGIDEEKLEALFESGIGVSNVNERLTRSLRRGLPICR